MRKKGEPNDAAGWSESVAAAKLAPSERSRERGPRGLPQAATSNAPETHSTRAYAR